MIEDFYSYFNRIDGIDVRINDDTIEKIKKFVPVLIKEKMKEVDHQRDYTNEAKRHYTGYMGEAALEQLFGILIIDWTIGESYKYNVPDIPNYNVGIKSFNIGNFPIITKKNTVNQIFCTLLTLNTVRVCGLATVDILNSYQSDMLIKSPLLRAKGYKTGFYGLDKLIPVRNLSDIEKYKY